MEDTEPEEGEKCEYTLEPDAYSYIDEKIANYLGEFQKEFLGGELSAESLGPKFGGYGSFLPAHRRSPRSPHKSPNNPNSVSPCDPPLEVSKMRSISATGFKIGNSVIYGRDDDLNRVIELISSKDGNNPNSTIVSIVADRGTGRTTMLRLLHSELCNAFDKRKFASMPEIYDEKGLMRVIIESLTEILCDITDFEVLNEIVKEEIMDQRLLLLLDNFENCSQKCWDLLFSLLKVCKDTRAVVVTTTRESVSKAEGPIQFYYMNNLSNKWCWMIFKEAIFNGEYQNVDSELEDVGKLLMAKCRNVTLCVMVLSGLLRHFIPNDWWKAVLDDNLWETDQVDKDVLPALRVCYEYLPSHLKQCFKFCSLFPKESIFSKEHLIRLWLSQGFIVPVEGTEPEDIGSEYFDQLVSISFFQLSLTPGTEKDKFVIPGLIHDLGQKFSKNECFRFEGCEQRELENARHLSRPSRVSIHTIESLNKEGAKFANTFGCE